MADQSLLLGIKLRIVREVLGFTQAQMAQKVGIKVEAYKKIEEAVHAPDCEKALTLNRGGLPGFTPYDARTRISRDVVDLLLPRRQAQEEV